MSIGAIAWWKTKNNIFSQSLEKDKQKTQAYSRGPEENREYDHKWVPHRVKWDEDQPRNSIQRPGFCENCREGKVLTAVVSTAISNDHALAKQPASDQCSRNDVEGEGD